LNLRDFVLAHTTQTDEKGALNVGFFTVASVGSPNADEFRRLIAEQKSEYVEVNPLDGNEHSYIELGAWVGDQGVALMMMGLGELLGVWKLYTPQKMFPGIPNSLASQLAGSGYITIKAEK